MKTNEQSQKKNENRSRTKIAKLALPLSIAAVLCISACSDDSSGKHKEDGNSGTPIVPDVSVCGDGILAIGESCDKDNLGGKTCQSWSEYVGGTLSCNASCEFNKSGCYECTDQDLSHCSNGQICSTGHCVEPGHQIS